MEIDRRVLTADFDDRLGLITCERALFGWPNNEPPRGSAQAFALIPVCSSEGCA